ncbi:serine protease inhibitor swm-1-like [Aricia agestis]|uniref:serine protease inhibitor swm-1-like n=1 Tax=Aricia agestis TaxID=91739 RepID=UPI001C20A80F|nr:serine protease inhibitor swm-1-like [Aricia agestis]
MVKDVPSKRFGKQCPTNEEYLLCGSTCPTNCTNINPDCSDDCAEGCFCLTGYVRDANGTCISIDKCPGPSQCGDNEEFVPCATVCPATCRVPEPEVCGAACGMGCFCKDGFYRDERSKKCVTLDNCPAGAIT